MKKRDATVLLSDTQGRPRIVAGIELVDAVTDPSQKESGAVMRFLAEDGLTRVRILSTQQISEIALADKTGKFRAVVVMDDRPDDQGASQPPRLILYDGSGRAADIVSERDQSARRARRPSKKRVR